MASTPHTPGGQSLPGMGSGMYKYPSVSSIQSMVSLGYMPPGHGYVPKKPRPDKPYGPNFVSVMNRTWRGPGQKYINYSLACMAVAILFYTAGGLYVGHRNVHRLVVLHTEVLGVLLFVVAISSTCLMFHFIFRARQESNRWRRGVRFRGEGLYMAAAFNHAYLPEDDTKLLSGTYGPRAVKEIPRPRPGRGRGMSRGGSRGSSGYATPTGRGRGRGGGPSGPPVQSKPVMSPLAEEPEPEREVGAVRFGGVRSRSQDFLNQEKPPRFDDFVDAPPREAPQMQAAPPMSQQQPPIGIQLPSVHSSRQPVPSPMGPPPSRAPVGGYTPPQRTPVGQMGPPPSRTPVGGMMAPPPSRTPVGMAPPPSRAPVMQSRAPVSRPPPQRTMMGQHQPIISPGYSPAPRIPIGGNTSDRMSESEL